MIWTTPKDWEPETEEEFKERTKDWLVDGVCLDHKDVCLGGKYLLFEDPDHTEVCVIKVNYGNLPPKVYIKLPNGPPGQFGRWVFTDESERTVRNSKRSRKNWTKRQVTANRKRGAWPLEGLYQGVHD